MSYQVLAGEGLAESDYTPRGGCREFFYAHEAEVIAEGPAETGKTLSACWKLHLTALKYPRSQWAILRKVQADLYGTVLQTWARVIRGAPVRAYGGERPEKYLYANGSTVWVGGMDKPGKVLSAERDGIYVNQAEQLTLDDWESLTTRTTGRNAVAPFPQLFGDCNPGAARHWIRERAAAGKLRLIHTTHRDNPTLYTADGALTEQGRRTLERLGGTTGIRRKRLYEGIWATAEGAVYDAFDRQVHVRRREAGEMKAWYLALDEGYTNPAVILHVGEDEDGRWHVFREWYERGKVQSEVVGKARNWYLGTGQQGIREEEEGSGVSEEYEVPEGPDGPEALEEPEGPEIPEAANPSRVSLRLAEAASSRHRLCQRHEPPTDHRSGEGLGDRLGTSVSIRPFGATQPSVPRLVSGVAVDEAAAGLIAELRNAGVPAAGAKGRVLDGIWAIQDRLKVQADGRPRLTVDPGCVNTINEFESYVWKQSTAGAARDEPVKENDHALDALRYLTAIAGAGEWLMF